MRAKQILFWLIFLAGVLATGETIASEASMAADDAAAVQSYLADQPDLILCATYSLTHSKVLRTELVDRKLLSISELDSISSNDVKEGMGECALLAKRGMPSIISTKENHRLEGFRRLELKYFEPFDQIYYYSDQEDVFYVFANGRLKAIAGFLN